MTEGMYACGGAAEDMAATMGDNLKGDLAILESGAQDMAIALSDWLMPAARGVVQGVDYRYDRQVQRAGRRHEEYHFCASARWLLLRVLCC